MYWIWKQLLLKRIVLLTISKLCSLWLRCFIVKTKLFIHSLTTFRKKCPMKNFQLTKLLKRCQQDVEKSLNGTFVSNSSEVHSWKLTTVIYLNFLKKIWLNFSEKLDVNGFQFPIFGEKNIKNNRKSNLLIEHIPPDVFQRTSFLMTFQNLCKEFSSYPLSPALVSCEHWN